jgi:hypothetical protein
MISVSRRVRMSAAVPWCAALLGALVGAMLSRPLAEACDCGSPEWRLTLQRTEFDATVGPERAWPSTARLEARPGTVLLWSEDHTTQTVDRLHAGMP